MANGTNKLIYWILGIMGTGLIAALSLTVAMQRGESSRISGKVDVIETTQSNVRERVRSLEKSDEGIAAKLAELQKGQERIEDKLDRLMRRQ